MKKLVVWFAFEHFKTFLGKTYYITYTPPKPTTCISDEEILYVEVFELNKSKTVWNKKVNRITRELKKHIEEQYPKATKIFK